MTTGFVIDTDQPTATCTMGDYEVAISLNSVFGRPATLGSGIVMQTGPNEFLGAGKGSGWRFDSYQTLIETFTVYRYN